MWKCDICNKVEVKDKGKGFRAFIKYKLVDFIGYGSERLPMISECTHQIRICEKCLKKNFQTIKI